MSEIKHMALGIAVAQGAFADMNPTPHAAAVSTIPPQAPVATDLSQRMAQATPEDCLKGMFLNGLLTAVEPLGAGAVAELKMLLGEKRHVEFFNYPVLRFLPAVFRAATLLEPKNQALGLRRLGRRAFDDFSVTPLGRMLLTVSSGGPRAIVRSAPVAYRTVVNYGTREVLFTSEHSADITVRRDFLPHWYHEGVMTAVLEGIGAKGVHVVGEPLGLLDARYRVSWEG